MKNILDKKIKDLKEAILKKESQVEKNKSEILLIEREINSINNEIIVIESVPSGYVLLGKGGEFHQVGGNTGFLGIMFVFDWASEPTHLIGYDSNFYYAAPENSEIVAINSYKDSVEVPWGYTIIPFSEPLKFGDKIYVNGKWKDPTFFTGVNFYAGFIGEGVCIRPIKISTGF